MTIKLRLGLSFIAMILLVALVGGFFMYSGSIRAKYYERAVLATRISGIAKEMNYFFSQQLRAFDYYMIIGEERSREDYLDYKQMVSGKFFEWKNLFTHADKEDVGEIARLENIYNDVISSADEALESKKRGQSAKSINIFDKIYTPKSKQLESEIKEIVKNKEMTAALSQSASNRIAARQLWISGFVIGFSVIVGFALSFYIFRFISRPLYQLQKGAEEFGSGNFDYTLELANSENEFGRLAKSFNEMCENIRKMQSQIIQLDRMSAMGQLAGGVAHELNNPLTGVLGQSQIMLSRLSADDPMRGHVEKIERAAIRCRKIVRELLDFSRQKDYNYAETDVHELIEATLLLCESDLSAAQVNIEKRFSDKIHSISISQPHIQQVFLNMINNALHAMSPGGTLTILTRLYPSGYVMKDRRKNNQDIVVPGEWMEVVFKDTGTGISEKNLAHIFDPFFTTKDVGKGTGLGLTISYGIIQNHKGIITAESEGPGKGAVFTIKIPYEREK